MIRVFDVAVPVMAPRMARSELIGVVNAETIRIRLDGHEGADVAHRHRLMTRIERHPELLDTRTCLTLPTS